MLSRTSGRRKGAPAVTTESDETLRPQAEINWVRGVFFRAHTARPRVECSYPMPDGTVCGGKTINAHSIQKRGPIARLADASNHVLSLTTGKPEFQMHPPVEAKPIGVNEASAFEAFCNRHDSSVFAPIEEGDPNIARDEHLFLMTYRAVLYRWYLKLVAVRKFEELLGPLKTDKNSPPEGLRAVEESLNDFRAQERWFHEIKKKCDGALHSTKYDGFIFRAKAIDIEARFAAASCSMPFHNTLIPSDAQQDIGNVHWLALTIWPITGKTLVCLAIDKDAPEAVRMIFDDMFLGAEDVVCMKLTGLALKTADNLVVAPDYWKKIPKNLRNATLKYRSIMGKGRFPGVNLFLSR